MTATLRQLNLPEVNHNNIKQLPTDPAVSKFKLRGKHFLYDENSMQLWTCSKDVYKTVDTKAIGSKVKPYFAQNWRQLDWKMLVIQSTYACNLDCGYCFVTHHYMDHTNKMDLKVAQDAINQYQPASARKDYSIGFFGGEPLLNWTLVYNVIEYVKDLARQHGLGYQFHITTNGTLVTQEMADYFAQNNVSFIISLDGTEEFHDNNRPYHEGGGTWKHVMRGLEYLANAFHHHRPNREVPITLRGTFDRSGVDLVSSLQYLNNLMYKGLASHVSVEPSSLGESCSTDASNFEAFDPEEVRAMFELEYWRAADWFIDELRQGRKPSFHHFEMGIQRIFDRAPAVSECGAGKGYISVGAGGTLAACHREHGAYLGNLYNGGIQPDKQAPWLDNRLYQRTTCPECWRRNFCGGGCRCNSVLIKGNIYEPSVIECLFKEMESLPVFWLLDEMTTEQKFLYSRQQARPLPIGQNIAPAGLPEALSENGVDYDPSMMSVQNWQFQQSYPFQPPAMVNNTNAGPNSSAQIQGSLRQPMPQNQITQLSQPLQIQQTNTQKTLLTSEGSNNSAFPPGTPDWVKNQVPEEHKKQPSEEQITAQLDEKEIIESETTENEVKEKVEVKLPELGEQSIEDIIKKNEKAAEDAGKIEFISGKELPESNEKIDAKAKRQEAWTSPQRTKDQYSNKSIVSDEQEEVIIDESNVELKEETKEESIEEPKEVLISVKSESSDGCGDGGCGTNSGDGYGSGGKKDRGQNEFELDL